MRRRRRTLIAGTALAALAIAAATSTACGGNSCGLGQLRTLNFPPGVTAGAAVTTPQFFDVDLSATDIQQINFDSTLIPGQPGQVDGFLTTTDCTQLFAGDYTGTASAPLCKIYIGPIAPGGVSPRVTLPAGRYRVFAQPWTTNVSDTRFGFDVVIWGQRCSILQPSGGF